MTGTQIRGSLSMNREIRAYIGYFTHGDQQYALRFAYEDAGASIELCPRPKHAPLKEPYLTLYRDGNFTYQDVLLDVFIDPWRSSDCVNEILHNPVTRLMLEVFDIEVPGGSQM